MVFKIEKIAVVAPIPRASMKIVTMAKDRYCRSYLTPYRISCRPSDKNRFIIKPVIALR
jgi:hypothetical protein